MPGENNVEVNEDRIREELKSAGATPIEGERIPRGSAAPGPGPGGAAPDAGAQVEVDWTEAAIGIVWIVDRLAVPNWALEADEKTALAEGTAKVLKAFFPTVTVDPRITACLALLTVCGLVVARRIDSETGELMPMRAPDPEPEKTPDADRAAA